MSPQPSILAVPRRCDQAVHSGPNGGVVVILRWDRETGWAWVANGRGAQSQFAGFLRLADPAALPTSVHDLGWELVGSHDIGRGLIETEIRVPLTGVGT